MSLLIKMGKKSFDLLALNSQNLIEINSFSEEEQIQTAESMVHNLSGEDLLTAISQLAAEAYLQPTFSKNGFNGLLKNLLITFLDKHDGEALHKHFQHHIKADALSKFVFSIDAQILFTALLRIAEENSTTKGSITLTVLANHLLNTAWQPVLQKRERESVKPKMFLIYYSVKQMNDHQEFLKELLEANVIREKCEDMDTLEEVEQHHDVDKVEPLVPPQQLVVELPLEARIEIPVDNLNPPLNLVAPSQDQPSNDQTEVELVLEQLKQTIESPTISLPEDVITKAKGVVEVVDDLQKHEIKEEDQEKLKKAIVATLKALTEEITIEDYELEAETLVSSTSADLIALGKQMLILAGALSLLTLAVVFAGASAATIALTGLSTVVSAATGAGFFAYGKQKAAQETGFENTDATTCTY